MNTERVIAKKRFGQNFLKDESVVLKIVEAMPHNTNRIVEIGPGLGDLTKHIVNIKGVSAFEVDTDLCRHLERSFKDEITTGRLVLECGDVLESWESELLNEKYDLVANLPYYIATKIILKALTDTHCRNMLVMVQREVAEKFSASPGEKNFGALSVITQSVATAEIVLQIPPEAFEPPPKVDSAVLLIQKTADRKSDVFEIFLRAAFAQPRKTLYKNLSARYVKEDVEKALGALDLPLSIRPHQVRTSDYHQVYNILEKGSLYGRRDSGGDSAK